MEAYVLCKYSGEYINQKLDIYSNDRIHPEDMNRIIDTQIRLYSKNNRVHTVCSELYDELNPDFQKYWCVASRIIFIFPESIKSQKHYYFITQYELLSEHEKLKMINDTIDRYFFGACDGHVREFISHFNHAYETSNSF